MDHSLPNRCAANKALRFGDDRDEKLTLGNRYLTRNADLGSSFYLRC